MKLPFVVVMVAAWPHAGRCSILWLSATPLNPAIIAMSLAQKYRKSFEKRWCLRFKTILPDGEEYDGIITHNQRQYVVLREERDFAFDGVLILPKKIIRGYRDDKHDRCGNAIIRENGAIKRAAVATITIPNLDDSVGLPTGLPLRHS